MRSRKPAKRRIAAGVTTFVRGTCTVIFAPALSKSGGAPALEMLLDVEPVRFVLRGVVDRQDHGHRLHQPVSEVALVNPNGDALTALDQSGRVRGLELNANLPVLDLAGRIIRGDEQIDPVVAHDALDGKAGEQRLALHMVDAEVGDDVFARPPFLLLGLSVGRIDASLFGAS